jgi:hypothetical protein
MPKTRILNAACVVVLAGCQTAALNDVDSPYYRVRAGSTLVLHQELNIPQGQAHVRFSKGRPVGGNSGYTVSCRFDVRNLGPQLIHPDTFLITRVENPQEWISQPTIMEFSKIFYLKSATQPDVLDLNCQEWNDPLMGRDISVPQVREALGQYFTLELAR